MIVFLRSIESHFLSLLQLPYQLSLMLIFTLCIQDQLPVKMMLILQKASLKVY